MKRIQFLTIVIMASTLCSCKVLSKSQIKNINVFAETADAFSDFPGELVRVRGDLVMEERVIAAVAMPDPETIKNTISDAQKNYKIQRSIADSIDVPFQLLKQYALLLTKLSSTKYVEDLNASKDQFGSNAGELLTIGNAALMKNIPPEAGTMFTELLFMVGERMTKAQQAKALKKFIPQGEKIIAAITGHLNDVLDNGMRQLIESDSIKFFNTYTNNVLKNQTLINYPSISQYAKAVDAFDNLDAFRLQCIESSNKLAAAHSQLNRSIATKAKLTEVFKETQAFAQSVNQLYRLYKKIRIKEPTT